MITLDAILFFFPLFLVLFGKKNCREPFVGGTLMKDTCDRREEELKLIRAEAVKASQVGYTCTRFLGDKPSRTISKF